MEKKRILIVEDEGITALDEAQILRDLGHEVVGIAISGETAVELAGADRPDLVLMDIKLAGEMDGQEATRKIRELYDIPVVYVTAFGSKAAAKSSKTPPPEGIGYIVKPYTAEELQNEIERLTG
ncbi:MAG: response regulator [Rhodospirillales bacterium]|nr:response regulator [Rhodospirillales bacterium]